MNIRNPYEYNLFSVSQALLQKRKACVSQIDGAVFAGSG